MKIFNKFIKTLVLFLISIVSHSQIDISKGHYNPTGWSSVNIVYHEYYNVSYSEKNKQPVWVLHLLTKSMVELGDNDIERISYFKKDPFLLNFNQLSHGDYNSTGYDRGHMVPARDLKFNMKSYEETFYTSNICPQLPELNRREWKYLEEQVRDWALEKDSILIFAGPIFGSKQKGKLNIPVAFWKIVYKDNNAIAFIMWNTKTQKEFKLCATSVDFIEEITGLDFLSWLEDDTEEDIESKIETSYWFKY